MSREDDQDYREAEKILTDAGFKVETKRVSGLFQGFITLPSGRRSLYLLNFDGGLLKANSLDGMKTAKAYVREWVNKHPKRH